MIGHLIACTITAAAGCLLVLALRKQSAAVRHAILLVAVLRFALPTPWLTAAGEAIRDRMPAAVRPAFNDLFLRPTTVISPPPIAASQPAAPHTGTETRMWVAWALGSAACAGLWWWRSRHRLYEVRAANAAEYGALVRAIHRLEMHQRVDFSIVQSDQIPGAIGWRRGRIVLPDGLSEQLTDSELEAILTHELAHISRLDNLTAGITQAVACVFWFHPLIWWMRQRMLAERETACDEMVLAGGVDRNDYAAGIAQACRIATGAAAYAGVTGSDLKQRLENIMSATTSRPNSRLLRALPATFIALAVLGSVSTGFLNAQTSREELGALIEQVEIQMLQQRPDAAIELLRSQLEKDPSNKALRRALGNILVRATRFEEAIAEFERLLRDYPDDPQILFSLAETYRRKGDLAMATELFRRASQTNAADVTSLLQLGLILDGTGKRDQAKEVYEQILSRDASHAIASNNLAFILAEESRDRGSLERALTLAKVAQQKMPDSPDIADTLGWVFLKLGLPDRAVPEFRDAVLKQFDSASFRSHLLMSLDAMNQPTAQTRELQVLLRSYSSAERDQRIQTLLRSLP